MSFNSKYSGQQVENLLDQVANGNAGGGGSGGITTELDPIFSASPAAKITDENISSWNNKVDKVDGKQLSTEDFTTLLKQKLDGLSNYDDTEIQEAVSKLRTDLDTLVSGDTTTAIKTFNEVIAFLDGISDTDDLASIIASIEQQIAAKGTYTKPSNGIPKSDLASAVQTSLGKADTALQSVPSEYVTETELNNKGYATSSQLNAGFADTERKFATLNEEMDNKQPMLVSGTNIKTINGTSILGSGDIVIEGGAKVYTLNWDGESESVTLSQEEYDNILEADIVVLNAGGIWHVPVNRTGKETSEELGALGLMGQLNSQETALIVSVVIDISTKLATFTMEQQDIPTKTSQLENDSNFVSSDGLKTINGESIVGSGDIVISSGSSSGGAYAEVNHGTSDTTFTLTPNTFHVWDEVSALDLSFGEETSGVANEYLFQFTSGATATTLTLPSDIKWANDTAPTIAENMIYQISVLKGLASVLEFSNAV